MRVVILEVPHGNLNSLLPCRRLQKTHRSHRSAYSENLFCAQCAGHAGRRSRPRTFVRLRETPATHEVLRRKIDAREKRYDARFQAVFATIRQMLDTPVPAKKPIGFHAKLELAANSAQTNKRMHK